MPDAAPKAQIAKADPQPGKAPAQLMVELKVSGHLMTLDSGLYCIVQAPTIGADPAGGLPGVRLSVPPGPASRPDSVSIAAFRADGWLTTGGDAALVRISNGPAQLMVTIYQAPNARVGAPKLQVSKLLEVAPADMAARAAPARLAAPQEAAPARVDAPAPRAAAVMEMVAHIQERGDVGAMFGDWLGERGSKRWIEGFGLSPTVDISPKDIEYQAVLGQGWLSPWVEGGQFCGSRAMALPLLGLRVRLRGAAAELHDVVYSAAFIDGTEVGPVVNGEACEADSLSALEAFRVSLRPRGSAAEEPEEDEETPVAAPSRGKGRAGAAKAAPKSAPAKPASKATAARAEPDRARRGAAKAAAEIAAATRGKPGTGRKR